MFQDFNGRYDGRCDGKAGQKIKIFDFLTVHLGKYAAHTYKSDKDKKIDFGCRIIPIFLVFCRRDS